MAVVMIKTLASVVFLTILVSGCQSALLPFPSGELMGVEKHTDSFAFATKHRLLQLETQPENPYSVFLRVTVIDGSLYIDAAPSRRWHKILQKDNRVKIKLGEFVYPATAIKVSDSTIQQQFDSRRVVYQIVPL